MKTWGKTDSCTSATKIRTDKFSLSRLFKGQRIRKGMQCTSATRTRTEQNGYLLHFIRVNDLVKYETRWTDSCALCYKKLNKQVFFLRNVNQNNRHLYTCYKNPNKKVLLHKKQLVRSTHQSKQESMRGKQTCVRYKNSGKTGFDSKKGVKGRLMDQNCEKFWEQKHSAVCTCT